MSDERHEEQSFRAGVATEYGISAALCWAFAGSLGFLHFVWLRNISVASHGVALFALSTAFMIALSMYFFAIAIYRSWLSLRHIGSYFIVSGDGLYAGKSGKTKKIAHATHVDSVTIVGRRKVRIETAQGAIQLILFDAEALASACANAWGVHVVRGSRLKDVILMALKRGPYSKSMLPK